MRGLSKNLFTTGRKFSILGGVESFFRNQTLPQLLSIFPKSVESKVYSTFRKNLLPVRVRSQVNPSHIIPPHFFKISFIS